MIDVHALCPTLPDAQEAVTRLVGCLRNEGWPTDQIEAIILGEEWKP